MKLATPGVLVTVVGAVLILAAAGWGYWHAGSHGWLLVHVNDIALKSETRLYGSIDTAEVTFRDATGRLLATGTDSRMVHPTAGDCRPEEREGGPAWRECFETQSQWFMTWVRQIQTAMVRLENCTIHQVPAVIEESRDRWWLWWVPHPHLDNSARTHFTVTMWIDSGDCRPADR